MPTRARAIGARHGVADVDAARIARWRAEGSEAVQTSFGLGRFGLSGSLTGCDRDRAIAERVARALRAFDANTANDVLRSFGDGEAQIYTSVALRHARFTTCRDDEEPWRMAQVAPSRRVDSPMAA